MSALNGEKISIVHWFSDLETHQCGYCKNQTGSVSYGMWAERLNVEDYQNLIDRGWRRSGMYCYKPMMHLTCCPQYTIKCSVQDFKLSKSQKKVIKRFNKFVTNGTGQKDIGDASNVADDSTPHEPIMVREKPNVVFDYSKFVNSDIKMESIGDHSNPSCSSTVRIETSCARDDVEKTVVEKHSVGPDLCKAPCKKAKILRIERKQQKLRAKGITLEKAPPVNEAKTLEEFLNEIPATSKYKFKIQQEWMSRNHPTFKQSSQLFKKYQMAVHNEPANECGEKQFCEFLVDTPLKVMFFCFVSRNRLCSLTSASYFRE
uniref:arginyltransferase n=1 Tax=Photinus pyralis TaxID=7054 RepID=A0A1Y1MAI0_PHOPY